MIRALLIKNLILIEEATVSFGEGLNIITGETGAGKTAIVGALKLLQGERSDATKVRKGCEKALVQASFTIEREGPLLSVMEQLGLQLEEGEELILTREITSAGKSRAFVGSQMVSAACLKALSPHLFCFIGQHAHMELKSLDRQRELLDQYGKIALSPFQQSWKEEKELEKKLNLMQEELKQSNEKKERLKHRLTELQEAQVEDGEEETLFEEYTLLSHTQELLEGCSKVLTASEKATSGAIACEVGIDPMIPFCSKLEEAKKMAKESRIQLEELTQMIQSFRGGLQMSPERLLFLEERLKEINQLKKRYGDDLITLQKQWEKELLELENLDDEVEEVLAALKQAQEATKKAAGQLSKERLKAAQSLSKRLSKELQQLNIPSAEVTIQREEVARNLSGEDRTCFFLRSNFGEKPVSVKESSSGGEMSRLYFALKIALTEGEVERVLIFDEIDANVGGETATIVGEKLHQLAKSKQVISITHFPQVAKWADTHLRIFKEEIDGRTIGKIEALSRSSKEKELVRMLGG